MVIDYKITGACNENCKFCWDFCKNQQPKNIENIKHALYAIRSAGIKILSLTGGEPLCYPKIDEVLRYSFNIGLKIYLSTNGLLLDKHIETISRTVTLIGLPLDSHNDLLDMGRKQGMVTQTSNNISMIRKKNQNIKIKIGTVLSKKNKKDVLKIGSLLFNSPYPPDNWRVYQFTPMGNSINYADDFYINDNCFNLIASELYKKFEEKVSFLSSKDVNDSYVFITPHLDLCTIKKGKQKTICNLYCCTNNDLNRIFQDIKIKKISLKHRKHLAESMH